MPAFTDGNGDGRPDFYIGDDGLRPDLMRNRGGMRFQNLGTLSGPDSMEARAPVSSMEAVRGGRG